MLTSGARTADAGHVDWADVSRDSGPRAPQDRQPSPDRAADVLAVNRVGFFGGVERVLLTAASGAATRGWRTVLACPAGDLARQAGARQVPVRRLDVCSLSRAEIGRSPAAWVRILRDVRRGARGVLEAAVATQARIIHTHHPVTILQARGAARVRKTPLIWHVHETAPVPAHYRGLARMIGSSCDLLVCVSEASRAMVEELGAPPARIRLVYNAVEPRFFEIARASVAPLAEGPNIGIFGVLEPRKGHLDLIRACAALSDRWPTLHLWIVGGPGAQGHEGYRTDLKEAAGQAGMGLRVHFTGRRDDIPEMMAAMDVVVSASICSESLPTVLLEASAVGVPVLGTEVGGAGEIIRHGETGLLAPPGAPQALAANLALLLSPAGQDMARRAHEAAVKRFSVDRFAGDIDDCYRQLAERPAESRT